MNSRGYPILAVEGWPFVLVFLLAAIVLQDAGGWPFAVPALVLMLLAAGKFRDPERRVPPVALGIVSPVDGRVLAVGPDRDECLERDVLRIVLRVSFFSVYSFRAPAEGKVMEYRGNGLRPGMQGKGLWLRTDENDDVRLMLYGPRWARPQARIRYGERLGQGQRCGFLRLARRAELLLPATAQARIAPGDRVRAGSGIVALLAHRQAAD